MAAQPTDDLLQDLFHATSSAMSQVGLTSHIPLAPFTPPGSAHRDIAVFEERLRSNLLYFRQKRRRYRKIQVVLVVVFLCASLRWLMMNDKQYAFLFQLLSVTSIVALFLIGCRSDYHRTMEHARTFSHRVNRTMHTYNLRFGNITSIDNSQETLIPGLMFGDRIPKNLADGVLAERKVIQNKLAARERIKVREQPVSIHSSSSTTTTATATTTTGKR